MFTKMNNRTVNINNFVVNKKDKWQVLYMYKEVNHRNKHIVIKIKIVIAQIKQYIKLIIAFN